MDNKRIILGLDVSTSCIGCCLMLDEGDKPQIIELTHVVPKVSKKIKSIESLFIKNKIFKEDFLLKWKDVGITDVIIEGPLLTSNNVYTVATLLRFNGMISQSVYEILGVVPQYISSYDARMYSFPILMDVRKHDKKGNAYPKTKIISALKKNKLSLFGNYPWDVAKKEVLQGLVSEMYPNVEWIYDKKGELKKENFDASDSFICCLGFLNKEKYGDLEFSVSNIEETENGYKYTVEYWNRKDDRNIKL